MDTTQANCSTQAWRGHMDAARRDATLPDDASHGAGLADGDVGGIAMAADGSLTCSLEGDLALALQGRALAHGCTPDAILRAAWCAWHARMTGASQCVLGEIDADGRLLAVAVEVDAHDTLAGLVEHLAARLREARDGGAVDVAAIVARGAMHDATSRARPLRIAFQASDAGDAIGAVPHTRADDAPTDIADASLAVIAAGSVRTTCRIRFDPRWSPRTQRRFAGHWMTLLRSLLARPDVAALHWPMLTAAQYTQTVHEWNATQSAFPGDACIHELFEAQVARTPRAPALSCSGQSLDYAQLNARANQLAHHLRDVVGVRPDDRIAICVERGIGMVVAMLAVLKAGAAYVPLDPAYPPARLRAMREDCAPVAVLVQGHLLAVLGDTGAVPVLRLEDASPPWDAAPEGDLPCAALGLRPDHLAYVVYTSGSTGTPKGVAVEHHGLCNLVTAQIALFDVRAESRVLQFASFSFDAAVSEVMMALCVGAQLHVPPAGTIVAGDVLVAALAGQGITHVTLPPAVLATLPAGTDLDGVHTLIVAGEALPEALATRWRGTHRLINAYGPSETTVCASAHLCVADDAGSPPIGRPIANTRIYLLDAHGQPVPVGVTGELHIGGVGIARGYLHRADLTAARFLPDPFDARPGARMYRTGDLGRFRGDGAIVFLGRNDLQVKVRGFRIELEDVQAAILTHADVADAVVVVDRDAAGGARLLAYVAPGLPGDLRGFLAARLPDYMLPALLIPLPAMPLTPNGKLDRAALPAPGSARPASAAPCSAPRDAVEVAICSQYAALLGIEPVGREDHFFAFGGNSLLATRVVAALHGVARAPDTLPATAAALQRITVAGLFARPTPAALAAATRDVAPGIDPSRLPRTAQSSSAVAGDGDATAAPEPIAIIAMAARMPGAADVDAFWQNLCDGVESITRFTSDTLDASIPAALRDDPAYVAARGVIDDVELFDAAFFGIGAREAELMDPQHRIFLELCWECMERAGHVPDASTGPVGVFAGSNNPTYLQQHVAAHPELAARLGALQVVLANEKDYIATRVAHRLNLTGPAMGIFTACSTSLVAICQAVAALRAGQCDMALAGAASITCPPRSGYLHQAGSMLSPDGHTRTFDRDAQGTVFSDGAGVVLLKRLRDALADGDQVHALVRGVAINNDGGHKASFTAPSSDGQAAVIAMAQRDAQVDARSIGYVEAHGTATPLGDPIEIEGLSRAFRRDTDAVGFCRIGSVKSNIGHAVAAAGVAGVIKTTYALREGVVPATLHHAAANPVLALDASPFVVTTALAAWPSDDAPRRAGVSSFGVGGTNAHVVMEQAPTLPASDVDGGAQLLVLSARSAQALERAATRLADHLDATDGKDLADIAWTLAAGRKAFGHRLAITVDTATGAVAQLRSLEVRAAIARGKPARGSDVVFLFPGQGAQYAGMGRALYDSQPAFRAAYDTCADALLDMALTGAARTGDGARLDLRALLRSDDPDALRPTEIMQPATFAIEYALACWWMAQGVQPTALLGHSVGEFVAATVAGVFSPADAIRLVARRGALMQAQPAGAMLSVRIAAEVLLARLPEGLSLAAVNAPSSCVVAGPVEDIAGFQAALDAEGIACRVLQTSHAFHSSMMDPVLAPFGAHVQATARSAPRIAIVSTVSGDWLSDAQARSAEYWTGHLRAPVRFADALAQVLDAPARVLLEVGPRATLTGLARARLAGGTGGVLAVASLGDAAADELAALKSAAGQLWTRDALPSIDLFDQRAVRRRQCLPTYPFERQRHWVDAAPAAAASIPAHDIPAPSDPSQVATQPAHRESAMSLIEMPPSHSIVTASQVDATQASPARSARLLAQVKSLFEDVAGFDLAQADVDANFMELGLDSLNLTQVALQLQKDFGVPVSFRQLMGDCASLRRLVDLLDTQLPAEVAAPVAGQDGSAGARVDLVQTNALPTPFAGHALAPLAFAPVAHGAGGATPAGAGLLQQVIAQQMQLMAQQLQMLGAAPLQAPHPQAIAVALAAPSTLPSAASADGEVPAAQSRYDVDKAFGAIARIHTRKLAFDARQADALQAFVARYVARTPKSKAYAQQHRAQMADPRVVSGFRPQWKEICYPTVIERSKGAQLWDIDGNAYVDANNGFGMSLFGWQPEFVLDAIRRQLDLGYEIGPQHPLAGEVCALLCELTGHDRAGLCNTGSEAVLGALRIARTVTGRSLVAVFNGSYHGINDEVVIRGNARLQAMPGAPGILRDGLQNMLVLDYGTPESLAILRERAHELAAVLVEPVQSRRPDFRPVEFLRELRDITTQSGTALVFDEVITGFRAHAGGTQALFGIQADIGTYGKVVGGGYPLGVIAGKRAWMDALDGGHWQFGDDSAPSVGVTYFAGTFVRHPLALAAAHAVLLHLKRDGGALQAALNARTHDFAEDLNAFARSVGAPLEVRWFASMWRTHFHADHPMQDLLFALMRSRGVHILDNFPCFLTTAHDAAQVHEIAQAWKDAVVELQDAGWLPRSALTSANVMDATQPPQPGARIGRDPQGQPGWYVADAAGDGGFRKLGT